jgi:hypothetical protein
VDFYVNLERPVLGGFITRETFRLLRAHRHYQTMKKAFLYMLEQEFAKLPTVTRSSLLPLKLILDQLRLTYDGEPSTICAPQSFTILEERTRTTYPANPQRRTSFAFVRDDLQSKRKADDTAAPDAKRLHA